MVIFQIFPPKIKLALTTTHSFENSENSENFYFPAKLIGYYSNLQHPNVVRLLGLYHNKKNEPYMVMEYISR